MFETVDKSIFEGCMNEMRNDDFIHNQNLDSKMLMTSALDVCSPRIDSYLLAKGIFDITDIEKSGEYLPNENITNDEIKGIIGRLFDLQITRFDGHSPFQTYLISAYTHKNFIFKNELLKYLVHSFIICFKATEKLLDANEITYSSYWNKANKFEEHCCKTDEVATRNFLLSAKEKYPDMNAVIDLAIYELDLAQYMNNFPNSPLPKIPEIPPESSDIGIFPSMEFRSLPVHAPPSKVILFDHTHAIQMYKDFYLVVNEYPKRFTPPNDLLSFITNYYDWGLTHANTLNFARVLLIIYTISRREKSMYLYGKMTVKDLFMKDLKTLYIPDSMFSSKSFHELLPKIETFIDFVVKNYTSQPIVAYGQNIKFVIPYWAHIIRTLVITEGSLSPTWHIPRTGVQAYDSAMKAVTLIWAAPVTIHFLRATVYLGHLSEVFTPGDAATNEVLLKCCAEVEQVIISRVNTIKAVHRASIKRGKKRQGTSLKAEEVRKELENLSEQEADAQCRTFVLAMLVEEMRWAEAVGALKSPKGQFYNAAQAYENRTSIFKTLSTFAIPDAADFVPKAADCSKYAEAVNERFREAKIMISLTINQYGKTKERTDLLMRLIKNNAVLLRHKGEFLKPVYNEDNIYIDIVPEE